MTVSRGVEYKTLYTFQALENESCLIKKNHSKIICFFQEVIAEAHQFYVLVQKGCSADLRPFLCGLYTPVCMPDYHKFLPPCRFLCERARAGCEPIMNEHGFEVRILFIQRLFPTTDFSNQWILFLYCIFSL